MNTKLGQYIRSQLPNLKGKLSEQLDLSAITWFRVGGFAEVFYQPVDEIELAEVLSIIPDHIPMTFIGLGSNLLVRDGGIKGLVIRLSAKRFGTIQLEADNTIRVGAAVPDVKLARAAAEAGISGFSFYRGIPGCIGGAIRMNAGAHHGETKDHLLEVRAIDRRGQIHIFSCKSLNYTYRHCGIPKDYIFTEALYCGTSGDPVDLKVQMDEIAKYRETVQPIKERTGGSTFKNPTGHSAWKLIDAAGLRGLRIGGAQMSEKHCNFMINTGTATAYDLEKLGETVRQRVYNHSGIKLEWEIKRYGDFLSGQKLISSFG